MTVRASITSVLLMKRFRLFQQMNGLSSRPCPAGNHPCRKSTPCPDLAQPGRRFEACVASNALILYVDPRGYDIWHAIKLAYHRRRPARRYPQCVSGVWLQFSHSQSTLHASPLPHHVLRRSGDLAALITGLRPTRISSLDARSMAFRRPILIPAR